MWLQTFSKDNNYNVRVTYLISCKQIITNKDANDCTNIFIILRRIPAI